MLAGRDLVTSVEPDRWAQDSLLHPNKSEPGTSYTFAAGSIGDVAGFDAAFFGISPREAEQMDPQQRVLLEMAWETFEQAGIPPSSMRGSRCGVYVGLSSVDYAYRRADDLGAIDATTMTGNAGSIAANRLSYVFDLHGPSMTIDTACSSSLVAFHQACQSIRRRETDAALVAGISLHLHPYGFIGFSKASMLSRHGRCRVFDAGADGYVRSEGGGVVLLKPLEQALADGNRILAVVAGTGVNSDGRKAGLTVPSHEAQAELLREVYGRAGISPLEIDYFEAHGTGTAVGDPIETRAIGEAIGRHRPADNPLPIGSIKGNIGHLEAAAGMAGLVQSAACAARSARSGEHPIAFGEPAHRCRAVGILAPVTEPLALGNERLVVGVSAFGFGGTNAHAVLTSFETDEEARRGPRASSHPRPCRIRRCCCRRAARRRSATWRATWRSIFASGRTSPNTTLHIALRITARYTRIGSPRWGGIGRSSHPRSSSSALRVLPPGSRSASTARRPRRPPSCTQATARSGPAWRCGCSMRMRRFAKRSWRLTPYMRAAAATRCFRSSTRRPTANRFALTEDRAAGLVRDPGRPDEGPGAPRDTTDRTCAATASARWPPPGRAAR